MLGQKISQEKRYLFMHSSQGEPMGAMMRSTNYTHPDVFIEKFDTVIFIKNNSW